MTVTESRSGLTGYERAISNAIAHIGVPSGRAGYGIVLSVNLPAQSTLRTMPIPGNPRRAHSGYVAEACWKAAARPDSMVTVVHVPHHDHADRVTLDLRRRQAGSIQKAGVEGKVRDSGSDRFQ